ncbi:MAG: dockerin type I repeat-containing protein [Planctomycetota bacterium]|jgi:hypothetical protein
MMKAISRTLILLLGCLLIILVVDNQANSGSSKVKPKPKSVKTTQVIGKDTLKQADIRKDIPAPSTIAPEPAIPRYFFEGTQIGLYVIGGGSVEASSASYSAEGTAGQSSTETGSSENYQADPGFWGPNETVEPCDCIPGDANGDESINVGDAVYLIAYVFKGGPPPIPYEVCSGDANGDCQPNVGDAVYLIAYVFKGGPPPASCEDWRDACGALQ